MTHLISSKLRITRTVSYGTTALGITLVFFGVCSLWQVPVLAQVYGSASATMNDTAGSTAASATIAAIPPGFASTTQEFFRVMLSGSGEVPAIATPVTGTAWFGVRSGAQQIDYHISLRQAQAVSMAHIHCGVRGANGPVVVTLFMNTSNPPDVDGVLNSNTIQETDIAPAGVTCQPRITNMAQLIFAMRLGQAYVNVHTTDYPAGEVRGQFGSLIAALGLVSTSTPNFFFGLLAPDLETWSAAPAVSARTFGAVTLKLAPLTTSTQFALMLSRALSGVAVATLHCGLRGNSGPVIMPLATFGPGSMPSLGQNLTAFGGEENFVAGSIPQHMIQPTASLCPKTVTSFADLTDILRLGHGYVAVHGTETPFISLRAQLSPMIF